MLIPIRIEAPSTHFKQYMEFKWSVLPFIWLFSKYRLPLSVIPFRQEYVYSCSPGIDYRYLLSPLDRNTCTAVLQVPTTIICYPLQIGIRAQLFSRYRLQISEHRNNTGQYTTRMNLFVVTVRIRAVTIFKSTSHQQTDTSKPPFTSQQTMEPYCMVNRESWSTDFGSSCRCLF